MCATLEPEGIVEIGDGFHDRFDVAETSKKLMQKQVAFDFINSKKLLCCQICDGYVLSPNGNKIYNLVLPKTDFIQKNELAEYLERAKEKGVNVITDDGKTDFSGISRDLTVSKNNPFVTFMHKAFEDYDIYMLMNTGEEKTSFDAFIPCKDSDRFCLVNTETLETSDVFHDIKDGKAKIFLEIDALSPVIICKY